MSDMEIVMSIAGVVSFTVALTVSWCALCVFVMRYLRGPIEGPGLGMMIAITTAIIVAFALYVGQI